MEKYNKEDSSEYIRKLESLLDVGVAGMRSRAKTIGSLSAERPISEVEREMNILSENVSDGLEEALKDCEGE